MREQLVVLSVACVGALLLGCGKIDSPAPAAKPAAAAARKLPPAPAVPPAKPVPAKASSVASEVNDFGDYATGATALKIKQRQEKALGKLTKQQQARGTGE